MSCFVNDDMGIVDILMLIGVAVVIQKLCSCPPIAINAGILFRADFSCGGSKAPVVAIGIDIVKINNPPAIDGSVLIGIKIFCV